ncbi:hypothetical protein [Ktedonosporobacter rubrisoli]|uniref:hypothetical protein n=1 Tax=Ktedonosporobacter rubrisoli TaxID=2509675 RepID=UPI0013EE8971|nr:hypothetical protein [Ktedonosporobacter rubrisoli]
MKRFPLTTRPLDALLIMLTLEKLVPGGAGFFGLVPGMWHRYNLALQAGPDHIGAGSAGF